MAEDDGPGERDVSLHVSASLVGTLAPQQPVAKSSRFSANIVEGQGRLSSGECKQFLGQARGSPLEVETQVLIAQELGYLGTNETQGLRNFAAEAGRILNGLLGSCPAEGSPVRSSLTAGDWSLTTAH
jgi:hypothetical protein